MPPKKRAPLRTKTAKKKNRPAPEPSPVAGTIDMDRLLSDSLRSAADMFNAAWSNAIKAGLEVQQQPAEAKSIGEGTYIHAHPVWLGPILRRYK